jgi:glucosamine--fructose-6-phosphate aminotransferase (isomerizing)
MNNNFGHSSNSEPFTHFMLKEIYEQPETIRRMLRHYVDAPGRFIPPAGFFSTQELRALSKITIAASGSSRHAGMVGKFIIERLVGIPVEVDFASQYCYRDPVVGPNELTVLISQSGTTVDTLAALHEARRKGSKSLAICNVLDSPLTRNVDASMLTHAGEEVAIAATKSFTTQLTALFLLSMHLAQARRSSLDNLELLQKELRILPATMESTLSMGEKCRELAATFARCNSLLVMGRDIEYPVALEGALKLKETAYIQAEGHPTGEIKHGPAALIDENLPVVVLANRDETDAASIVRYKRTVSNIRQFAGRGISVLAVITEGDREILDNTPFVISLPPVPVLLQPILEVIPLQLLAYYMGTLRGYDVDRPRHLSKSVLVE